MPFMFWIMFSFYKGIPLVFISDYPNKNAVVKVIDVICTLFNVIGMLVCCFYAFLKQQQHKIIITRLDALCKKLSTDEKQFRKKYAIWLFVTTLLLLTDLTFFMTETTWFSYACYGMSTLVVSLKQFLINVINDELFNLFRRINNYLIITKKRNYKKRNFTQVRKRIDKIMVIRNNILITARDANKHFGFCTLIFIFMSFNLFLTLVHFVISSLQKKIFSRMLTSTIIWIFFLPFQIIPAIKSWNNVEIQVSYY